VNTSSVWIERGLDNITPRGMASPEGWDVGAHLAGMVGDAYVLDYGCGVGRLSGHFPPLGYVGYDINPHALHRAREAHPAHKFTDICPGAAGVVLLYTVALHLPDDELARVFASVDAERWIIAEIMGRKWRSESSVPPAYNREASEYVQMFPGWRVDVQEAPYAYYPGAALTILDFQR
jgi:SAM-dependent methyltransferase